MRTGIETAGMSFLAGDHKQGVPAADRVEHDDDNEGGKRTRMSLDTPLAILSSTCCGRAALHIHF